MMNDSDRNHASILARLDPRLKTGALMGVSVFTAILVHPPALLASLAFSVALLFLSGVSIAETAKRLVPVNVMVLFLWIFLPFTVTGTAVDTFGPFTASREGVDLAIRITMKANAMMGMFIAFSASTSILEAGQALARLGAPRKLVHLFYFTVRYIGVIDREFHRLRAAMAVRGFIPATSLHTYRSYACLVGMVLVRSSDRAERVYRAMLCRGFNGTFHSLTDFSFHTRDALAAVIALSYILSTGWLEWGTPLH
jgi:cobalt/nickel transport system permease protein